MLENGLGWPHLLILAAVVVLLFGAKRLPDAARGLGRSIRILKAETAGLREDDKAHDESPAAPAQQISADTAAESQLTQMQQQLDELQKQLQAQQTKT